MDVEIPANSSEIAYAMSLGDLRENAEYKAAKEKQQQLQSQEIKLKEEIEKAKIFDPKTVNTSRVSFGTKVVLRIESTGQQKEYTILGQWESDPNNNIISFLSPFGDAILNKKEGDRFEFGEEEKINYLVESITPASI
jgi:transcription elongation factor GreA